MASPQVATRQPQRRPSFSPSQSPLKTPIPRPTPSHSPSSLIPPNVPAGVLDAISNCMNIYPLQTNSGINMAYGLGVYNTTAPAQASPVSHTHLQGMTLCMPSPAAHVARQGQAPAHSNSNLPTPSFDSTPITNLQWAHERLFNSSYVPALSATNVNIESPHMLNTSTSLSPFPYRTEGAITSLSGSEVPALASSSVAPPISLNEHDVTLQPTIPNNRKYLKHGTRNPSRKTTQSQQKVQKRRKKQNPSQGTGYHIARSMTNYSKRHPDANFEVWTPEGGVQKRKSGQERSIIALTRTNGTFSVHQQNKKRYYTSWRPDIESINIPHGSLRFDTMLKDIWLFRPGPASGHPLSHQRQELVSLKDIFTLGEERDLKRVTLIHNLGQFHRKELTVWVSQFAPLPGNKINHHWFRQGQPKIIDMPTYCIARLQQSRLNLLLYIQEAVGQYVQLVIQNSNETIQEVLRYAWQYAQQTKSTLVGNALRLLGVNRMIEHDWSITSIENLGIQLVTDPDCPWYGKVPITPMMDTQLDQMVIKDFLGPVGKSLLSELQEKMCAQNREYLFDIFLALFILDTNLEWLLRHSRRNALRYNVRHRRYNSIDLAQQYIIGHNALLSHFHVLLRGSQVSAAGSYVNGSVEGGLTPDQHEFMTRIQQKVFAQWNELEQLRQNKRYEAELYWSHQLFQEGWMSHSTDIPEEIPAF